MYYWKCWHDTRRSIVAYLAAVAICSLLWLFPQSRYLPIPTPSDEAHLVVAWSLVAAWVLAIVLGATGPGADIGDGLGPLLLTRPRSRAYFTWVAWATGLVEVIALIGATVGVMTAVSTIQSGGLWYHAPWDLNESASSMIGSIALVTLVTYGLTYLLTMGLKSGKRAIIGTIVITTAYAFASEWLRSRLGITLPSLAGPSVFAHGGVIAIGWVLFALACPLAAQTILVRAEV